ncbi:MAG: zf-TFIIB domain-containing protein [Pirellulaceae bacterium]|nr:zf-TFIIB domain-containing protein [Pirellulaceae bacterium]
MNCESCSDVMTSVHNQDYFHCQSCNAYRFPTDLANSVEPIAPLGQSVDAVCPKCHVSLETGMIFDRWEVCFCNNCRGVLIQSDCVQVVTHELRAAYKGLDDPPRTICQDELNCRRNCPACAKPLDTHAYYGAGNVVIDSCCHCALTWLDHGELNTMIRAPGSRPDRDSSPIVTAYKPAATIRPVTMLEYIAEVLCKVIARLTPAPLRW